jgi:glycerol-1-phosphate dehydrogenase [NAD(P)+]
MTSPKGAQPSRFPRVDPTDIDAVTHALRVADPDGRLAPIGLRQILIGTDALRALAAVVAEVTRGPRVVVVIDATPMRRGSDDLKLLVVQILSQQFMTRRVVIGAERRELHGDEHDLTEVARGIEGADCVVALGSGTITDLCKEATRLAGGLPLVLVQTAASVNAFSDDMAVLLRSGTKRTTASRWADALLIDLTILAGAPQEMTLAGFGDLMAVWTAPADWYLASLLGMDDSYHPAPVRMLYGPARALLEAAAGLPELRPDALDHLARVLTLSGFTMGVAGKTAPLSGTEHLIAHLIDMAAIERGHPTALHGAQVAATTILSAAAWQIFLSEFDPARVDLARAFPPAAQMEPVVRAAFAVIDPSGRIGAECWNDYRQKLERWHQARPTVEAFMGDWPAHRAVLAEMTVPPEAIAGALRSAGAPAKLSDLAPGVSPETARWALLHCHLMRNRCTVADLLFFLGSWDTAFMERVLDRARAAGGGL